MADVLPVRDEFVAMYLQHLQALAGELSVAMDAIASNSLSVLEESVAKQEMLCGSLATMETAAQRELQADTRKVLPLRPNAAAAEKIRAATRAVGALNLQYASLLKHSGKSIALLSALCKSHTGQTQEARGFRSKHQTWSCEM